MRHPHSIIAIHALIGTVAQAGGAIVRAHGTISPEEIDEMTEAFRRTVMSQLQTLDAAIESGAPDPVEPEGKTPERLYDALDVQEKELLGLPF